MRSDDPVHLDEVFGVPPGLEWPHAALSFTRRLMRALIAEHGGLKAPRW
jgi:hypothetical protein